MRTSIIIALATLCVGASWSAESANSKTVTIKEDTTVKKDDGIVRWNTDRKVRGNTTHKDVAIEGTTTVVKDGDSTTRSVETHKAVTTKDASWTRDRSHQVTKTTNDDGSMNWERHTDVKDSRGHGKTIDANGHKIEHEDGSGSVSIDRSGTRYKADGSQKSWDQDVEKNWVKNDLGGDNIETNRVTTTSTGKEINEDIQRQTRTDDNSKAYREAKTITKKDGTTKDVYQEGRTDRRELSDGYVTTHRSKGIDSNDNEWQRETQKIVRWLKNGQKYVKETTATRRNKTHRSVISEGKYVQEGKKRWHYVGTVTTVVNGKTTETKHVNRTVRRLPVPANKEEADKANGKK